MCKKIAFGIVLITSLLTETVLGQSLNDQLFDAIAARSKTNVQTLLATGTDMNAPLDTLNGQDNGPGKELPGKDLEGARSAQESLNQALFAPIRADDGFTVGELIRKGADVNARNINDAYETPLLCAAKLGKKAIAKLLIDKGADVTQAKDRHGRTPLHFLAARCCGFTDLVEILIAKGENVNATDIPDGNTPLHNAVMNPDTDSKLMLELLIRKGADVNARNAKGETPLQAMDTVIFKGKLCMLANHMVDQDCVITRTEMTALLQDPHDKLSTYLAQFKGHSANDDARASIINLALQERPTPAIPAEAEAAAGRMQSLQTIH